MSRRVWAAVALAACVGGGGETPPPLHGNVSVGLPVQGAAVTVTDSNGKVIAGPVMTDAYGSVTFSVSAQSSVIAVTASGGTATFGSTQIQSPPMATLLRAGESEFAITPLSQAAVMRGAFVAGKTTPDQLAAAIAAANAGLAQQFGLQDVLGKIPADATKNPVRVVFPAGGGVEYVVYDYEGRRYGLVLAGFVALAATLNVSVANLIQAFWLDVQHDGVLDGLNAGTPITVTTLANTMIPLAPDTFTTKLQAAITAFASSPANMTKIPSVTISPSAVPIASGALSILTVNPECIQGTTFSETLQVAGATGSVTWSIANQPPGIDLDGNKGVLAGMCPPCKVECTSPPFTITVTDSASPPNTTSVQLMVISTVSPPTITMVNSPLSFKAGDTVNSPLITSVSGGVPPYSYIYGSFAAGTVPFGLYIDGMTGNLVGKPTVGKDFTFQVGVVDAIGHEDFKTVKVSVTGGAGGFDGMYNGSVTACGQTYGLSLSIVGGTITGTAPVMFTGTVDSGGNAMWVIHAGTETDTFTGTFTAGGGGNGAVTSVTSQMTCKGTWTVR